MNRRPLTEIGVSTLIALASAIILHQALTLPPGTFEPLGSGPVPSWTSIIVIFCCLVVILRAIVNLREPGTVHHALLSEFKAQSPGSALLLIVLSLAYVLALQAQVSGFGIVTFTYLTLLIWSLSGFGTRTLIFAAINGAIFAFGAEYLFIHVFVVDLPT